MTGTLLVMAVVPLGLGCSGSGNSTGLRNGGNRGDAGGSTGGVAGGAGSAGGVGGGDAGVDSSGTAGNGGADAGSDGRIGTMGYLGGPCVIHAGGGDTGGYYSYCYDRATTCDGNVCVACGGADQDCCSQPNNGVTWSCTAGLACARSVNPNGVCTATCGGTGAACCKYGFCQKAPVSLVCTTGDTSGTCQVCGTGEGSPCCGRTCPAGFACSDGICTSGCGASGGACCPGYADDGDRCQQGLGLGCDATSTCVACGGDAQPCCNEPGGVNALCATGLQCQLAPGSMFEVCTGTNPPGGGDAAVDGP